MIKVKNGIPFKKGDIVRLEDDGNIYEVERDNEFCPILKVWTSVWLKNKYPPQFTHKGGIELVSKNINDDS